MEIITGYTSKNHVTSADDASLYRGILGADDYVLEVGSKFDATIIDNNTVRVMDGDLVIQGHQARIRANDYNEVTIDNGTAGQKRNDLIVARYIKNTETGIESITLEVIKGTPGATAIDPEIIQEDLKIGGTQRDYPLYRVALDGINLTNLTTLFNVVPTITSHLAESATQGVHGATSLATPYTIASRDDVGRLLSFRGSLSLGKENEVLTLTQRLESSFTTGQLLESTNEIGRNTTSEIMLVVTKTGVSNRVDTRGLYLVSRVGTGNFVDTIQADASVKVELVNNKVKITNTSGSARTLAASLISLGG